MHSPLMAVRRKFSKISAYVPSFPGNARVKRFYKDVNIVEHPASAEGVGLGGADVTWSNLSKSDNYWAIKLDNRVVKTMYKDLLLVPTKALAIALA